VTAVQLSADEILAELAAVSDRIRHAKVDRARQIELWRAGRAVGLRDADMAAVSNVQRTTIVNGLKRAER
jgi:hypothetical protein